LFTNSSDGEEKTNLPMPEEFASRTLARRIAWLKGACKIIDIFKLKSRIRKI
jgi:hypothetical protein